MESKNFTLKIKHRFTNNAGSFYKQPVINLLSNNSLTGGAFLSVYRIVNSKTDSASLTSIPDQLLDGRMGVTFSDGDGLTSVSGSKRIRSNSIVSMSELESAIVTTAQSFEYSTTMVSNKQNEINLLVEENEILFDVLDMKNLKILEEEYNYVGNGVRPKNDGLLDSNNLQTITPNGTVDSSLILQYFYNAMENCGDNFAISGLTGVYDWSGNSNTASIFGQGVGDMANYNLDNTVSGTVTGHTAGAVEGGFRMEGNTYIKTTNSNVSNLFNIRNESSSGFTMMTFVKLNATGDTDIMTISDGTDTLGSLRIQNGCITFSSYNNSISAGLPGNPSITAGVDLSRWIHLAATIDSTAGNSLSGSRLYINGEASVLAGTNNTSISSDMYSIPVLNDALTNMHIGINPDESSNALTGTIGMTRIFNRPLKESDIFMNFIATIPSQNVINEINIA